MLGAFVAVFLILSFRYAALLHTSRFNNVYSLRWVSVEPFLKYSDSCTCIRISVSLSDICRSNVQRPGLVRREQSRLRYNYKSVRVIGRVQR